MEEEVTAAGADFGRWNFRNRPMSWIRIIHRTYVWTQAALAARRRFSSETIRHISGPAARKRMRTSQIHIHPKSTSGVVQRFRQVPASINAVAVAN